MDDFSQRIRTDASLREELKKDPRGVLERHGRKVPEGIQITVVESTAENVYLVLPIAREEGELTEEELTAVSGGMGGGAEMGMWAEF
jgi:hypothetical protein